MLFVHELTASSASFLPDVTPPLLPGFKPYLESIALVQELLLLCLMGSTAGWNFGVFLSSLDVISAIRTCINLT